MTTRTTFISILMGTLALATASDNGASTVRSTDHPVAGAPKHTHTHAPAQTAQHQPPVSTEPAATIPDFTFYILKSGFRFTKADLAETGNVVFILFDPTCGHCQHEARDIGEHYDDVKTANLYFISMNDPALMASFLETWAPTLVDKANVEVLYDRGADFVNKFHIPSQYPATYVYGADGRLKEYWAGERPAAEIVAAINK